MLSDNSLDKFITRAVVRTFLVLFLIIIFIFFLISYSNIEYAKKLSLQNLQISYNSAQKIVLNQVDATVNLIANSKKFSLFLQEGFADQKKDKYDILADTQNYLLSNHYISGISVHNNKTNQALLQAGHPSDLSLRYQLQYTNDYLDNFGGNRGYMMVYINKKHFLQFIEKYGHIQLAKKKTLRTIEVLALNNTANGKVTQNLTLILDPKTEYSQIWLAYFSILIITLISFYAVVRNYIQKMTSLIKYIYSIVTDDTDHKGNVSSVYRRIDELDWIIKVIDNYKLKINKLHEDNINITEKLANEVVNDIHKIKSMLSALKLNIKPDMPKAKIEKLRDNLNYILQENTKFIIKYQELGKDTNTKPLTVSSNTPPIIDISKVNLALNLLNQEYQNEANITLHLSEGAVSKLILLNYRALNSIVDNILTNSIEANAKNISITTFYEENYYLINITDDGDGCHLDADVIFQGHTSKQTGTGIGLSTAKKLLNEQGSDITINKVKAGFSLTIKLKAVESHLINAVSLLIQQTQASELIYIDDDNDMLAYIGQLLNAELPDLNVMTMNQVERFTSYVNNCRKSHILDNHIFIVDNYIDTPNQGLELIEALEIQRQAILFSSDHINPESLLMFISKDSI